VLKNLKWFSLIDASQCVNRGLIVDSFLFCREELFPHVLYRSLMYYCCLYTCVNEFPVIRWFDSCQSHWATWVSCWWLIFTDRVLLYQHKPNLSKVHRAAFIEIMLL